MNKSIYLIPVFFISMYCALLGQTAQEVTQISITVSELETILPFYEEVLTFKQVDEYELKGIDCQRLFGIADSDLSAKVAVLQLGQEQIELIEFINEDQQNAIPLDSKSNDLWFQHIAIVVSDMEAAYKRLRTYEVQHVSSSPQTLPNYLPAAAGISAFYFQDPDGHNLEVIHFPVGKGDPRWQTGTDQLFLGIDHTAIGIQSTKQATTFYENVIGLKVAGNSENYGTEQEHLNQVFGAHLIITGLKAQKGIGVEFLDYLAPPGGRPYPTTSQATDLWHWHQTITVPDVKALYQQVQADNFTIISNGVVQIQNKLSFMLRDPNGHAILITQN